jgi:hypothetical protein
MKLPYPVSLVFISSLPRLFSIASTTAYLVLAGCSTYETGTPKAAVNYQEDPASGQKVHDQVGKSDNDIETYDRWRQLFGS